MICLVVVLPSSFFVSNIFECGLLWFVLPAALIIVNDIMAYFFGFYFGEQRTQGFMGTGAGAGPAKAARVFLALSAFSESLEGFLKRSDPGHAPVLPRMISGRTPLIHLSPKKTWEGFLGAFFSTMVIGYYMAKLMARQVGSPNASSSRAS